VLLHAAYVVFEAILLIMMSYQDEKDEIKNAAAGDQLFVDHNLNRLLDKPGSGIALAIRRYLFECGYYDNNHKNKGVRWYS
jgi:hypothetical protein